MIPSVRSTIHRASAVAGTLGAVLSPIPLADEVLLLPVYGVLSWRIGRAHGLPVHAVPWRPVAVTAVSGLAARALINLAVSFLPGVAAVANATSAVALTEIFGRHVDDACADPAQARAVGLRDFGSLLRRRPEETAPPNAPDAPDAPGTPEAPEGALA